MWPWTPKPGLRVGLSARALAAWSKDGWQRWSRLDPLQPWSAEELREALSHVAGGALARGVQVDAMLAPELCRHWLQAPVTGAQSWRELETVVRSRCIQLFGVPPEGGGWTVAADGIPGRAMLCAALPERWLDHQRALQKEQGVALRLRSAFQRVLNARPREAAGWAAWATPGFHTVMSWEGADICSWISLPHAACAAGGEFHQEHLSGLVQREQLMQGLSPTAWHVLTETKSAQTCEASWACWAGHEGEGLQWRGVAPQSGRQS